YDLRDGFAGPGIRPLADFARRGFGGFFFWFEVSRLPECERFFDSVRACSGSSAGRRGGLRPLAGCECGGPAEPQTEPQKQEQEGDHQQQVTGQKPSKRSRQPPGGGSSAARPTLPFGRLEACPMAQHFLTAGEQGVEAAGFVVHGCPPSCRFLSHKRRFE